jgi:hypothetical protein
LTTLEEVPHDRSNMTRSVSTILNTVENIQAAAEEFSEHITTLNHKFKADLLAKVKELKRADTQLLTERVSMVYSKLSIIGRRTKTRGEY